MSADNDNAIDNAGSVDAADAGAAATVAHAHGHAHGAAPTTYGVAPAARAAMPGSTWSSTLESKLGHRFDDRRLLARALTHRSRSAAHNERLEHLGDSVLGFIITDALYARFPDSAEGDLTRMRAQLVRREELAARARELELQPCLRLGGSVAGNVARNQGGDAGDAMLADAFEAVLGAVYLDGGLETVKRVIFDLFAAALAHISPHSPKDAKTRLQELLQKRGWPLPQYEVTDCAGKSHAPVFTVACTARGLAEPVTAIGDSRRAAEQRAAQGVLERLADDA